jgi:phosphoribosyl-dephospho-CoA transferase
MTYENLLQKREAQAAEAAALVKAFVAKGGQVTFVKPGRKTIKTFNVSGSVANKGAKAITLRNSGLFKR